MNKRRTLNHSIIYILGSGIQALIPFILIPLLTQNSSQSTFGLLMVMISLATVLSFVLSFGIPIVLTRELVFDESNSNTYKELALKFQSLLFWLAALTIVLASNNAISGNLLLFLFSLSSAYSLAIIQIRLSILRAEFKPKAYALLAISSTGIPLVTTYIFSLNGDQNMLFTFSAAVLAVAGIIQLKSLFLLPNYKNLVSIAGLVAIGYPMIFHSVAISLFQYGDKLAGYLGIGSDLVAEIAITSLFMTAPMLLLSSINNAWLPSDLEHLSKNETSGYFLSNKVSRQLSALTLAIAILLIVSVSALINYIVPENYDQIEISKSIIIGLSFTPLYILYLQNTHIIAMKKKFKIMAKITPAAALIQFIFTFVFVKSIGLTAPAIGLLVALAFQALVISIAVGKSSQLSKAPILATFVLSVFSFSYLTLLF
jgi:O-antigen/teichoic acid export membrane protein